MISRAITVPLTIALILLAAVSAFAQNQAPPAQVVVALVETGMVTPETQLVGTIYFVEVSDVATEIAGKVEKVNFDEGLKVKKGQLLVRLNSDLLDKSVKATQASYQEARAEMDKARLDRMRSEELFRKNMIPESDYDKDKYTALSYEMRALSLSAEVERLKLQIDKKSVMAPFDGVVIDKMVDLGEWVAEGAAVARVCRQDVLEVVVNVPQTMVKYVQPGMTLNVDAGGFETHGEVFSIIPRGDVSTRTFPVKVRIPHSPSLMEGMEATVRTPSGETLSALMVPRDAVMKMRGQDVLFAVVDGQAAMMPVEVLGYQPKSVGVRVEGLREGMQVVVKGNARLRPGQPVAVQNSLKAETPDPGKEG